MLQAIKERKLQLFFLIYILLVIPLVSPIAQNVPARYLIANIFVNAGLLAVLFLLFFFMTSKTEKVIASLLLFITLVPGVIFLAYLLFAHVLLFEDSIISLFETNPEESKEFVAYYLSPWVLLGVGIYAVIPIILICKMKRTKRLSVWKHKYLFLGCMTILFFSLSIERITKSIYFVNFYRIFFEYKMRTAIEDKAIKERQTVPFAVTTTNSELKTIIVIIGESETRHHMSLYGYNRPTNPLLSKESDLLVYKDVISPQVHTIPVIRSVMSFADKKNPDYIITRPSLFELFNRAGYETYFISNQPFGGNYRTSYDNLLEQAQHIKNLSLRKKPDEVILEPLKKILTQPLVRSQLIVIHLIGSHMAYEFRYPAAFNVFNHRKDGKVKSGAPYLTDGAKTTIDRYDNTVLYNDSILAEAIELLKKRENPLLVYFSDHGEEVYDYRDFAGHAYEKITTPMCEIPFLVWIPDNYRRSRGDLCFDINRPYSTDDFIYSLSDLAGLRYDGYDDSRSLFSYTFKERERLVGDLSYESVIELTNRLAASSGHLHTGQ